MMRNRGSRALPATPTGQLTRRLGRAGKPCSPCAAIGRQQGRPRSHLPYKYCSQHQHKRGEKGETRGKKKEADGRERNKGKKIGLKQGREFEREINREHKEHIKGSRFTTRDEKARQNT